MATVGEGIYARLSAVTAVTDLCSTRIYPGFAPLDVAMSYIVYSVVESEHMMSQDGAVGLLASRVQITAWASTESAADALGEQIRLALQGYAGTLTISGASYYVRACFLEDRTDEVLPEAPIMRFGRRLDFRIWTEESKPS